MSEVVIQDVADLIDRRERRYGENFNMSRTTDSGESEQYKPLILFSSEEYNEIIYTDYDDDECYKSMLEGYNGDVNSLLLSKVKRREGDDEYEVSARNAKSMFQAEKNNFNKITWQRYTNNDSYGYNPSNVFTSKEEMEQNYNPIELTNADSQIKKVKTKRVLGSDLLVPDLQEYDVLPGGTDEEKAMLYINMLSPYMQKWIIPWSILIDTDGDNTFVKKVMSDMYHKTIVNLYELNQENKHTKTYYYLEVEQEYTWDIVEDIFITPGEIIESNVVSSGSHTVDGVTNTKDQYVDVSEDKELSDVSQWVSLPQMYIDDSLRTHMYKVDNVKVNYKIGDKPKVALDENGEPMIQKIEITREVVPYKYVPKLIYLEDFYNIYSANYEIVSISENNSPDYFEGGKLDDVVVTDLSRGIGVVETQECWRESFKSLGSKVSTYKVSYYKEEDYEKLNRRISRIEWKQDWGNVVNADGVLIDDNISSIIYGSNEDYGGYESEATVEELLDWILPLAQGLQEESGLLPSLTIAQKIQESGWNWDDSEMETVAHNYWGMKTGDHWTGDVFYMDTFEDDGSGNLYEVKDAAWRAFDTEEEGFRGRGQWFWTMPRYTNVLLACIDGDWEAAVDDFRTNGYATDITYADKLHNIIEKYELYQYDNDVEYSGKIPEYATYNPSTGEAINGTANQGGTVSGVTVESDGVEFETDPYYSEAKNNPIFPEKTAKDLAKAYRNYSNGLGYTYDQLDFAFEKIDEYYPEEYVNPGTIYVVGDLKIPEGGFGWPVEVNDGTRVINALYGYTPVYGEMHYGIDISRGDTYYDEGPLSKGPEVLATYDGTVTHASADPVTNNSPYTYVEIKTSDGNFLVQYGHLSEIYVSSGDTVKKGQKIGRMGTTGNSTGVHLHLEMYDISEGTKVRVDPLDYYVTDPTYGTIERSSITKLPTGYVFVGSKIPTPINQVTGNSTSAEQNTGNGAGTQTTFTTSAGTFIRYRQGDPSWASVSFGGGESTMNSNACGPTSISIVLSGMGLTIPGYDGANLHGYVSPADGIMQPTEVAKFCEVVGGVAGSAGMYHSFPGQVADALGLQFVDLDGFNLAFEALNYLNQGYVGVASVNAGYFSSRGHIIAVVGTDGNGNIGIVDPANAQRDGYYTALQMNSQAEMPALGASAGRLANVKHWWFFKKK